MVQAARPCVTLCHLAGVTVLQGRGGAGEWEGRGGAARQASAREEAGASPWGQRRGQHPWARLLPGQVALRRGGKLGAV